MFSQLQLLDWLLKDSRKLISKKKEKTVPGPATEYFNLSLRSIQDYFIRSVLFVFPAHVSPIMLLVTEIRIYF